MTLLIRAIVLLCIWTAAATAVAGEPVRERLPGAVTPARSDAPSHAWVLSTAGENLQLIHLAPRDPDARAGAAPAGAARTVRALLERPVAMAARGDRVYVIFPPTESPSGLVRRVLTARAVPAGLEGMWTDLPLGVFDLAPGLTGGGLLIDLGVTAGRDGAVHALMHDGRGLALLRMASDGWEAVELPEDLAGVAEVHPDDATVVSYADGLLLAVRGPDRARAWTLDAGHWAGTDLADWDRFWSADWRLGWGREIIAGLGSGESSEVWSIGASNAWRIGSFEDRPGEVWSVTTMPSSGRLVRIGRTPDTGLRATEISLATGRVVHDGPVQTRSPVSADEFRLIAAMLLAVMIAALMVIIRPSADTPWTVPDGWALADPGRRLIATLFDLLLVIWVVAPAFGANVREVLTLQVLMMPDHAWLAIPGTMIGGALTMGVWEGLLGFSPGKFIAGVRVYRAAPGPEHKLGVFWGLVRCTIKWLIPPVAALALIDREGRHRGDAAAKAVVVARTIPQSRQSG
ncbi:MAG: hypothetical protein LAT64_07235 [Phycisphaerales bacterium]|nr:RDD family protein [Planctomycetota bacterium]MCH8508549.1 hypothetical protein [Phycisphaerales bacterium]